MIPSYTYAALAFSAFTSATLLPGTSEAAFALFVRNFPKHAYGALLCACLANGLGSMVSYWMGRLLPSRKMPSEKTLNLIRRFGIWLLAFAWLPVVGDALPLTMRLAAVESVDKRADAGYRQNGALRLHSVGNAILRRLNRAL